MLPRFYQANDLQINKPFILDDNASHHLSRVLRANVGDEIIIFNGKGGEFIATITTINKKQVEVEVKQFVDRCVEVSFPIFLAQGIARGDKMDFIVQKAVELGVSKIFPLITERCNVRLDEKREAKRLQHWQAIVASACEQSGRNILPEIIAPQTLDEWLQELQVEKRFVLSPHAKNQFGFEKKQSGSIALLIGPEGGLSAKEIALAESQQFQAMSLGPRILRTETATVAALTAIQCYFGDF